MDTDNQLPEGASARHFSARCPDEQQAFLQHTWCDQCQQADLGMDQVCEYEYKGVVLIEGRCLQCREPVYTELTDDSF